MFFKSLPSSSEQDKMIVFTSGAGRKSCLEMKIAVFSLVYGPVAGRAFLNFLRSFALDMRLDLLCHELLFRSLQMCYVGEVCVYDVFLSKISCSEFSKGPLK